LWNIDTSLKAGVFNVENINKHIDYLHRVVYNGKSSSIKSQKNNIIVLTYVIQQ